MSEEYFIDPPELLPDRTELHLTPVLSPEGIDYPTSTYQPFWADADIGQVDLGQGQWLNREMTVPLRIKDVGGTAMATWRSLLAAKVGEIQATQFGVLKRVMPSGGTVYADILSARIKTGGDSLQAIRGFDVNASIDLVLSPESYGDWVELDVMRGTGEIVGVLQEDGADAVIAGDFPPGNRCRIVITDTSGNDQRGLIAALRGRNYDSAYTAYLARYAENCTALDAAATARNSAAEPAGTFNVMRHASLSAVWTPVLSTTDASSGDDLTHVGTYRVLARVYSTSAAGSVSVRLVWDVNDLIAQSENSAWTIPDASKFYIADLGTVRLARGPVGDYRWVGQIQAKGAAGGENVDIDTIWLVPTDEYAAFLTAAPSDSSFGLSGFTAHDEFNQTAGALTGKTLPAGGTWSGAGDTDDYTVDATLHVAKRTANADSGTSPLVGRVALATATAGMTAQAASVDLTISAIPPSPKTISAGLMLRYVDANNWLAVVVNVIVGIVQLEVVQIVARALTLLSMSGSPVSPISGVDPTSGVRLIADVTDSGIVTVTLGVGDSIIHRYTGSSSVLATGGALAAGSAGIYDYSSGVASEIRTYDNFACWAPEVDAVVFARTAAELRTEGHFRQDSTGTGYGQVADAVGNLPRLPNGGAPVELLAKWSRGDLATLPDSALDAATAQPFYRPCWLSVPA